MSDDLQFDSVETNEAAASVACGSCSKAITDQYWEKNDSQQGATVLCPTCHGQQADTHNNSSRAVRLFRALAFGAALGAVGTSIYYGVRALTGYEIGLISILVGVLVGAGVRAGCYGRGGLGYQLLAAFLTYSAIVANYLPDLYAGIASGDDVGAVFAVIMTIIMIPILYAAPFMALVEDGAGGLLGVAIIGFGVWQAWRMNRKAEITFAGPFRVSAEPARDDTSPNT